MGEMLHEVELAVVEQLVGYLDRLLHCAFSFLVFFE